MLLAHNMTTLALLSCLLGSLTCVAQDNNRPPQGYQAIFNGRDLTGWHGMGDSDPYKLSAMTNDQRAKKRAEDQVDVAKHWTVQDGELVNDGSGVYLTTDLDYGDIDLWIDYKTVPQADSGIYLRSTPQVQIWDSTEKGGKWSLGADKGSGGLWNNSPGAPGKDPLILADHPLGEWNRFHIRQVGSRTTVTLNDKLIVQHAVMENYWNRALPLLRKGPIQLQTHGGEIRWRNIFVRELSTEVANRVLGEEADKEFIPLFNGKDLTGWQGARDGYEIVDGSIQCRTGTGGTLYTAKKYTNFVLRLEIKIPPGGNNGLAIRYPGEGDPAYSGMCELQVLDTEHSKYASLDPRQAHGSAYGQLAAHRGYLRDAGEWNFQEITVQGSKVRVELNGSVILDGDLGQVTNFMNGSVHPGKDLASGYLGFAGHGDPVAFRNIRIKKLP
ncbi:MAG: DUF1080 domain-containing protein [Planctomycetota bacterium]|nr:DUF1080 domain-containing protein [Planctomycetota bacterium]MDA1179901.1 DUF1080 domain-containing protein [Planctomycetota bacterium]